MTVPSLTSLAGNTIFSIWVIITMLLIWAIFIIIVTNGLTTSPFANFIDTGYNQRFQDINGVSEISRQNEWISNGANQPKVSGLTGSRDVPVFFQDFDVEMQAKGGNLYNQRETFTGASNKDCGIPGAC